MFATEGSGSMGHQTLGDLLREKLGVAPRDSSSFAVKAIGNPCSEVFLATCGDVSLDLAEGHYVHNAHSQKECKMEISKLIALADPSWEKDLKDMDILSDNIAADELRAEIKLQADEARKVAVKEAAAQIVELGRMKNGLLEMHLADLRNLRAREKLIKQAMTDLENAWAHGSKTLNYLPLSIKLGVRSHQLSGVPKELLIIQPVQQQEAKQ